jgi:hypothetical protein
MIYFVCDADGQGAIKIGTTVRLSARLKQLEKEQGVPLRVLGVMDGSYADETALHGRFVRDGRGREWFRANPELTAFIAAETRPWDGTDEVPLSALGIPVKMDANVIHTAKIVAAHKDISLAEYLSEVTRPIIERDYKDHSRRALGSEDGGEKPPKSKGRP